MAKKSSIAVNIEYGALRAVCALVNVVPYRLAMLIADGAASFAVRVLRFKRARTMDRIRSVFPLKSPAECRRIAVRSLANVLKTAVEMIRAPRLTRDWMDRHIVEGRLYKDRLQEYVDEGKGVVIMVPHSGNWYMAAWSMAAYGLPLFSIAARQRNPKIDAWMKRDLRVPQRDVEVDFLGGKANVSHAGAMFAVRSGCPIVVAMMRRERGRHVFDHIGTLRPDPSASDRKAEAARLTREAMAMIDGRLREHPEDWYWYNKRWILQPVAK